MSKAFTSDDATTDEAALAMPSGRRPVTPQGMQQQRSQLQKLTQQLEALVEAPVERGHTDPRKRERQQLEAKIAQLAGRIALSDVMAADSTQVAAFGSVVHVRAPHGERLAYRIVGPDEVNAAVGHISHLSPLGRALIGASADEEVVVHRPKGDLTLQVVEIAVAPPPASGMDDGK